MGLGYRRFVAQEKLTAANVNGYLMDQSVMVFGGTAARGTALGTAVAEGMVAYLTDSDSITVYDGSAWQTVYPASTATPTVIARDVVTLGTAVTASMTATAALANGVINVTSNVVTITVPDVLDVYDRIDIIRNGGGTVTIAAGTGITDWAGAGTAGTTVTFKIDQTYNGATVMKTAANTYRVIGKITA
jgi:hypothetical protein